jgi:succinate dehydrogenase / fumarate reductase flavoprotein subunit
MGGLWVDYELMTTIPGLYCAGEANFSDHGANRLGASALMQGLADGYFVVSYSIANYLAGNHLRRVESRHGAFDEASDAVRGRLERLLAVGGRRTPRDFHRELGRLLWDNAGMARSAAGLRAALAAVPELRAAFWEDVRVPGDAGDLNQGLEYAGRVADYLELAELLVLDALHREESCGGHFRVEHQSPDGEAERDDARFAYVAAWQHGGDQRPPTLHRERLSFEHAAPTRRVYA